MKIYPQEISDGLESLISDSTIAFTVGFNVKKTIEKPLYKAVASSGANPNQIDLLYLETILASTGMNENDDIFIASELLKARNTPIDKPFNYMHNESFIIGHITSARLVDRNQNPVDVSNDEDLPTDLDLITGSVIYKHYEDKAKADFIEELIEKIYNDEYFVSMECLLNNFDYGLIDAQGNQCIVPRTKETAHMSKCLRRYKGSGEFNGMRIGRVLRDYTFSGKGLVDNPANKRSHILSVANKQELEMAEKTENTLASATELVKVVAQAEYDAVKAELAEMKKAIASKVENEIESYKKAIASANVDLENSKNLSAEKDNKIAELEKAISEVSEAKAALENELATIKADKIKAGRVAALVEVGVEQAKAQELTEKYFNFDDTLFSELVGVYTKANTTKTEAAVTLETVKPTETAPLGEPTVDLTEKTRAATANWLGTVLTAKKTK